MFNLEELTYPGDGSGYGAGYKAYKVLASPDAISKRADGSYDIIVSPQAPAVLKRGENWLPTIVSGRIHLILRVYFGSPAVTTNAYVPPPVVRFAAA